jgi:hypothetical protein
MRRLLTAAAGLALAALAAPAQAATGDFTTSGGMNAWYKFDDSPTDVARPSRRGTAHRYRRQADVSPHRRRTVVRPQARRVTRSRYAPTARSTPGGSTAFLRSGPGTSRACLTRPARALLARIEGQFGAVQVISTCRPGARVAGTGRISRHASGNAVDFNAGPRKAAIVRWLIANHHSGGTMTYARMSHIHVDIGPRFVSLNAGARYR